MVFGISLVVGSVLWNVVLLYARWHPRLRCECGRVRPWCFYSPHERHAVMIMHATLTTFLAAIAAMSQAPPFVAVTIALFTVWGWWIVKRHGEGKRRWPKKAAGLVKVNAHGRLVTDRG